ncbi:hypothetical protein RIEGSTA812A_PEG_1248 [invertebrate metagenome]|uniref:Organic solvent tolerance-like N-terminal domain-containing protein n=1 Tax=invertebrate metagenome TaxID=1711999 RepID=A0A484H8A7_9ZZZZ
MIATLQRWVKVLILGTTWLVANSLWTQGKRYEPAAANVGLPTAIQAEQGIKWQRNGRRFTAHGNVRVNHRSMRIGTDTLTASYYDRTMSHTAELDWLQAAGNIRVTSPMGTASGEAADYDVYDQVLCLIGYPAHLETATETLTARKVIEYREEQQVAVARGDVHLVTQEGCVLRADMITADFRRSTQWMQKRIILLEVTGGVRIEMAAAISRGEHALYNAATGLATVMDSVKITSSHNQLQGTRAIINTKSGLSRLYTTAVLGQQARTQGRVKLLLLPNLPNRQIPCGASHVNVNRRSTGP